MSFLQPLLLVGLPLVALPILIHLMNRRRHRTIRWGAMMFLLETRRRTQRMARIRFWLIMSARMLAVLGLIFAASRPLSSGAWTSMFHGQADTAIILLDRSASMQQQQVQTGQSKRSTALSKLAELFDSQGAGTQLVLIESTENRALPIDSLDAILESPATSATSTAADIPRLLQTALDYVVDNQVGRTDIWICSDLRENDWQQEDGRWAAIRSGFEKLPGVRFMLLTYPGVSRDNLAVWIDRVRKREGGDTPELVFDMTLRAASAPEQPLSLPVELVINGSRTVLDVEMAESRFGLQGHAIPLDEATTSGWGRVELPADENLQDNIYYFVFAEPPPHHTVIVSDDPNVSQPLRVATSAPLDPALEYTATVLPSDRVDEIPWEDTALLLWQAALPDGVMALQLQNFVKSGRPAIFFPPPSPSGNRLFNIVWGNWQTAAETEPAQVSAWRGDADLLAHTQNGQPLPVGNLRVHRHCQMEGSGTVLARLSNGQPLLLRPDAQVPAYFCATLPGSQHSSLAQDGIAFYVMLQRALTSGAATLGSARHLTAGTAAARALSDATPLVASSEDLLATRAFQAGVFRSGDALIALNRPAAEDLAPVLDAAEIETLFAGLDFQQLEDQVGSDTALSSELWRAFLLLMALALAAEACLCLPDSDRTAPAAAATSPQVAA